MRKSPHDYTEEQIEYLRTNRNVRRDDLHKMFNEKFGTHINKGALCGYMVRNRILSDSNGQFKKGELPWNTGKSGYMGANKTSFKPGNRPHTWLPVGTERVNPEGYLEIKIAEPDKWKTKHTIIWEQHHKRKPPKASAPRFFAKAEMGSVRFQQRKMTWRLLPSAAPIRPASVPLRHIIVYSMRLRSTPTNGLTPCRDALYFASACASRADSGKTPGATAIGD